ncbi:Uncharacterised protein [Burkholderia pseudomallei]|uniref:hypothetical protein n=1 Tax=Burkholderia pseudomallei TaxID=28450 RepID=UPI000F065572|nr:hypothetical protein [Burkholderia pseudomallei]MBF3429793.1 hypothetical protein [Burkholderia pseudomallei]MBF3721679.1 hypothetical protein [Burkholderia pseudomallei]MBF3730683.1 hypothetical protein [Burkholderia pseudomallei]MBF3844556.1 hypothetical protein [Burkholderia pseudomallei]MBF4073188.1 hypothetical protein [Burkholderia pseudomallei]
MKDLTDDDEAVIRSLVANADTAKAELIAFLPRLSEARKSWARNPEDPKAIQALSDLEAEATALNERLGHAVSQMQAFLEMTDEESAAIEGNRKQGDEPPRNRREDLTVDRVASNEHVDELLGIAFDKLLSLIPRSILKEYLALAPGLPLFEETSGLLSIVKGVRRESEYPRIHRFAQCILECRALLENDASYDMFAGASLIPQIARLADRIDVLADVPGATKRIRSLWKGASLEVDSTIFELLVAAGCRKMGRSVEFLDPAGGKSPDLRCHDPYPLVIECKRKRVLTQYELGEEGTMRDIFMKLEVEATKAGMWGVFALRLDVDARAAPVDEIVASLVRLRFANDYGMPVAFIWGEAAYHRLDRHTYIGVTTRMYSPAMLEAAFGWNSDLPKWDGLVCRVANHREPIADIIVQPIAVLWDNRSEEAIKKRSWGPMAVLKEAIEQIPPGEFGIPYVAYQEGARREIADMRTFNFHDWLKQTSHPANIRVPLARIVRMYPRPLAHGAPDFIENSMSFVPDYGDDALPEMFPATIIVR